MLRYGLHDGDDLQREPAGDNMPSVAVLAVLAERLGVGLVDLVAVDLTDPIARLVVAARARDRDATLDCLGRISTGAKSL